MLLRCCLLATLLLLGACQTPRVDSDYDPQRDFAALHTWRWAEPALQYRPDDTRLASDLTAQRVREAVAEQLERRGLRSAAAGAPADLQVQAWLIVEQRQQQVVSHYGGFAGPYWGGYWGGMPYSEVRTLDYRVGTLQLDLRDSAGHLVWRGSAAQVLPATPGTPAERSAAIRATVAKILDQYPPRRR